MEEPKRVADLHKLCEKQGLMADMLRDGNDRSQQTRLGHALKASRDRVFDGLMIKQDAGRNETSYALAKVEDQKC